VIMNNLYYEEKLHDYKVKIVPKPEDDDPRPMKGTKLTGDSQPHHNIFLCAMKNSGKTTIIYNLLKACADKHTTVVAFVGTLHSDPSWLSIQQWCEDNDIVFDGYTEFDNLAAWVELLEQENEEKRIAIDEGQPEKIKTLLRLDDDDDVDENGKPRDKRKFRTPKYIFIADDMGELKNKEWATLLKRHRHYQAWTISSSQYFNDLSKPARKNVDLIFIFGKINMEKLKQIHDDANILVPFPTFLAIYKKVTSKPYNFLWINTTNGEMRSGFNNKLVVDKRLTQKN